MKNRPLIVLVGPTGIGKTAFAIAFAEALRQSGNVTCEVISADSRQIYQYMDIGTAKPEPEELAAVKHHLVDIVSPQQTVTLAEFQNRAFRTIDDIHDRESLPLLVGGTGQWVKAVVEGWGIPKVPPDPELRQKLEVEAARIGAEAFHTKLNEVDPVAASKIDYRNIRRVIRALEVFYKTGTPISTHQQKSPPPYQIQQVGLTMARDALYNRIDARIDRMMERGLLQEVEALLARGYGFNLPAMSGLGYRQFAPYFQADITLEEAIQNIKRDTRRFIRQQYNWFDLSDPSITWFDVSSSFQVDAITYLKESTENRNPNKYGT
ncbi:MAG: tRNA (adenosine(37)-N6)-dimethylallyltransferase MiaA [Chloroflexota bacterium]